MAMVFKSKKETSEPLKKNMANPGPGEYIPQTLKKKYFIKKKLSNYKNNEINNNTFYSRNTNPGPGEYFQNDIPKYKKFEMISNNEKPKIFLNENTISENFGEKLGFKTTAKRFKDNDFITPGPGAYFPLINKFYSTNFIKKLKYNFKPRQIVRNKYEHNLIPSIPSKTQKYGFNILDDGKIVPKKAPNFNQTFTGEKGDTVGPGYYELKLNNELYKSSPQWTIAKEGKGSTSLVSTNYSDNDKFFNNNSSNLLSSITANKFYVDDNLNIKESSPYNISNYSFNSNYSYSNSQHNWNNLNININKIDKEYNISDNLNINKFKRIPLTNIFHTRYNKINDENIKKDASRTFFKLNNNPGPGCYIDIFKSSSFNYAIIPENQQFFGSNSKRFNYKTKSMNDMNINHIYNQENQKENKRIKIKKIKELSPPFSSSEERFKSSYIFNEKASYPSPFNYYPNKIKKAKSFSNFNKFGTNEIRFIVKKEIKMKNEIPGPGTYDPEQIKSHINTKKMILTNEYNNKIDVYKNDINYNLNTIEYKNLKKSTSTNLKNVLFNRTIPTSKNYLNYKKISPSPGQYYKDKKYEIKQTNPPFHSSSNKIFKFTFSENNNVGPGQYNRDSYFDWNKKSFNLSYN